jgi:basic membrane protein A
MANSNLRRRALLTTGAVAIAAALIGGTVGAQSPAPPTGLKATYVSTTPIGVNPFLALIAEGLERAGAEFGVETSVTETADISQLEDNLRAAIEDGNDLIVANSFDSVDAITRLSAEYPDQKWALVDTGIDGNANVRGLVFKEHEGAYLVGLIMGLLSSGDYEGYPASDAFGAVGAFDFPFVRRWYVGFEEGVKSVKPDATFDLGWVNSWNDPATSKELALTQAQNGASYIFAFAAAGNFGIFEGAAEQGFLTSGVDTDQRSVDPAHIVESVVKRTDVGVYDAVKDLAAGTFEGGYRAYGLAESGVGPAFLILDEVDPPVTLPQEVQDAVADAAAKIVSGEIVVTDYLAQPAPAASPAAASPAASPAG